MLGWLLFCLVLGCLGMLALTFVSRRKGRTPARETGAVVEPAALLGPDHPWRLVGAAVMPGAWGKVSATWPLGLLECHGSWLELRIRPGWVARLFGARPLRVSPDDDAEVFPARGYFGRTFMGIRSGEREGYFGCADRAQLMGRLQASGYRVVSTERKIVYR